jgi:DNA end-binding protein Ku
MARSIWTGSLSFGLVNVPVKLYSATHEHEVSFHQFEKGTSSRIRNKRVNEDTGDEVDFEDIVKGAEIDDGRYVIITPEELESVEPGKSRTIDISDFVDAADIDPIYFQKSYYLGPADDTAKKAYALLAHAMEKAERIGIATFVMRNKQYLAAIRPHDGLILLETMFFADEVRNPRNEVDNLPTRAAPRGKELKMATDLIESLTSKWDPKNYRDTYTDRVEQLIKAKKKNREVVTETEKEPSSEKVVDLLSALQASIDQSKGHKPGNTSRVTKLRTQKKSAADAVVEGADDLSKADLEAAAKELDVEGRSKMSEKQLRTTVKKAAKKAAKEKSESKKAPAKKSSRKSASQRTKKAS